MEARPASKTDSTLTGLPEARPPVATASGRWFLFALVLFLLAYLPALFAYGLNLWQRGHYQFFPLAVLGAILLARDRLIDIHEPLVPSPRLLSAGLLGWSLLMFVAGTVVWSPWLCYLSALLTLLALAFLAGGRLLVWKLMPAFLLLAVLITPPLKLDSEVALRLRGVAMQASSRLLDMLGVPHVLAGAIIEIRGHRLLVEEACSGIASVFFIAAFALFHGLWKRRPFWHIGLVGVAGVSFVVLGNILRITAGAYLAQKHEINVLSGWPHEVFGAVLLLAYVGLVLSADTVFTLLRRPQHSSQPEGGDELHWLFATQVFRQAFNQVVSGPRTFPARWLIGIAAVFLAIGVVQARLLQRDNSAGLPGQTAAGAKNAAVFEMPEQLGLWQRLGDDAQSGQAKLQFNAIYSKTWTYRKDAQVCMVAISYPYPEYHDLSVCYVNSGWELGAPAFPAEAGGEKIVVQYDMTQKPAVTGFLVYGGFNDSGEWRPPSFTEQIRSRFSAGQARQSQGTHYMVQLLSLNYHPFSPGEKAEARKLFLAARETIRKQALNQRAVKGAARP